MDYVAPDRAATERSLKSRESRAALAEEGDIIREDAGLFAAAPPRTDSTLLYDPPYENDLDDVLAQHLVAYLVPAASLTYRASVRAAYSTGRFDFLIDLGTRRIALDYTDTPDRLETAIVEDNDALVLGTGAVDVVLRIRRRDLEEHFYDCLHVIAKWEPGMFTPYGQRVFTRRATDAARGTLPEPEADLATISYTHSGSATPVLTIEDVLSGDLFEWPDEESDDAVVVRRLSRLRPGTWRRQYARAVLVYSRAPISCH